MKTRHKVVIGFVFFLIFTSLLANLFLDSPTNYGTNDRNQTNSEGLIDGYVNREMQKIENKVAADAVKQYEIAERQGDKMQMYVQASMCSAAFLQAQDEANYKKWKGIESKIAQQIGVPTY